MEEDSSDMLNFYLASEETNALFDSSWIEESVCSDNKNKMADDDDSCSIQDLFDGETNPEVYQDDDNTSLESWGEKSSTRDAKEITDEEIANLRVSEPCEQASSDDSVGRGSKDKKTAKKPEKSGLRPDLSSAKTARARRSCQ